MTAEIESSRANRWITNVSLLATLVLVFATATGNASAGEFVVHPCDAPSQNVGWERPQFSSYNVELECPLIRAWSGAGLGTASQTVVARYPAIFARDTTVYIKRARMRVFGLSHPEVGRHQGVRFCSKTTCGPVLPRDSVREGDWEFSYVPGDPNSEIPMSSQWIEVIGACDIGVECPEVSELRVSDIELTYEDFVVPKLTWNEPFITSPALGNNRWISASTRIDFSADDGGSGVAYTRFEYSPSGHVQFGSAPCTLLDQLFETRFCSPALTGREWTPDPKARPDLLPEGANTLRFWVSDMGRRSSAIREIKFNVDVSPPKAPANMRIAGAPSGWTNQTVADIEWDPIDDGAGGLKVTMAKIGAAAESSLGGNPGAVRNITLAPNAKTPVEVWAIDRAGNVGASSTIEIGHDDYVLAPPALDAPRYVGRADLESNTAVRWAPPADLAQAPSGVCGYSLSVDDDPEGAPPSTPNIPGSVNHAAAPGDRFEGEHQMHLRAVSCSGEAGGVAHAPVEYDLTSPQADHERPRGNWLTEGEPLVIVGSDAQTGVKAMHYTVDDGPESSVSGDRAVLSLPDGLHEVRYQAEDLAGNRSVSRSIVLGVDGSPPTAWIEASDPDRPTLVRAFAADSRAGLESAQFVIRPADSTTSWRPFGAVHHPAANAAQALSMSARLPDTELPDGDYQLGVVVRDRVGREAVSTGSITGLDARVRLPVRSVPRLRFGVIDNERSLKAVFVPFAKGSKVAGRLAAPSGSSLARAELELSERKALTTSRERVKSLVANAKGEFSARIGPGVAREINVMYRGSEQLKPVERSVFLHTRSKVELAVSRHRARVGDVLRFDMRVALAGSTISNVGKLADLQFISRSGEWKNYTTDGPFSLQLDSRRRGWARLVAREKIPPLKSPCVLRFRLLVPMQERWPYAQGWSKTVSVLVLPRARSS